MATKEDILEQIVEEYLIHEGYFVRHNVKFLPDLKHRDYDKKKDANHSDIDVLAVHPRWKGCERIMAVSCKSWQNGFNVNSMLNGILRNKKAGNREAWKFFRELASDKWSDAFCKKIEEETGSKKFTYMLAVTFVRDDKASWEKCESFRRRLEGNPIKIIELAEIVKAVGEKVTKTLAGTDVGRTVQLFKAAKIIV